MKIRRCNTCQRPLTKDDDLVLTKIGKGIVLHSPNNLCWETTVGDTGVLGTKAVTCPFLDRSYDGRQVSKIFNNTLRAFGFEKIKTKCWNSRPTYWKRKDAIAPCPLLFKEF